MPKLSDFTGSGTQITALSIALGQSAVVMPGSSQFQLVGSILARAVYTAMAVAYPGQTMYSSVTNAGSNLAGVNAAPTQFTQIATNGTIWVGVTASGSVYSSNHGYTTTNANDWVIIPGITGNSVAYSGTTFCVMPITNPTGICYTSTNGTVWTTVVGQVLPNTIWKISAAPGPSFAITAFSGSIQNPMYSSSNGSTWTSSATALAIGLTAIGGAARHIAFFLSNVSTSSNGYTSVDGSAWSSIALPSSQIWSCAASDISTGKTCVIAYNSNVCAYSASGASAYSASVMPVSAFWTGVTWNGSAGLFVAVGNTASAGGPGATMVCATSPDGNTWTARAVTTNLNGLYYAVSNGQSGAVSMFTPNIGVGQLMVITTPSSPASYVSASVWYPNYGGAAYNATTGTFVQIGGANTNAASYVQNPIAGVTNTLQWNGATMPAVNNWMGCAFGNGNYAAISANGTVAAYSTNDGGSWLPSVVPSAPWSAITYGINFVAVAGWNIASNVCAYSANGSAWTGATMPSSQRWVDVGFGVVGANNTYVAITGGPDVANNVAAYSTNGGATWTASTLPANLFWFKITFGNGLFLATASVATNGYNGGQSVQGNVNYATSPDGITWTARTFPSQPVSAVMSFGNGMFFTNGYSSVDGINWVARAGGPSLPSVYGQGLFVAPGTQYFIDNMVGSQYICLTGTAGTTVRVQ